MSNPDDRTQQIASCFSQGINPDGNVADYGDLDQDYSQQEIDFSNAVGNTERYYDQCNGADNEFFFYGEN